MARRMWAWGALSGAVKWELPSPRHFDGLAKAVSEEQLAAAVVCGLDPAPMARRIQAFIDATFTHVTIHNVGKAQDGFFRFFEQELAPVFREAVAG